MRESRLALLVGSGVSVGAGLPSTGDITSTVLAGEGFTRHSRGSFHRGLPSESGDRAIVEHVLQFLQALHGPIQEYFAPLGRRPNYEDLYYMCSQLLGHESGDLENPLVAPFVRELLPRVPRPFGHPDAAEMGLYQLADEASHYIADVTLAELSRPAITTASLALIVQGCGDPDLSMVDIFSLNHDTILEGALTTHRISVTDGFEAPVNGVRYWNPSLLDEQRSKITLFKLHGSVDWYRLRPEGGHWHEEAIGIVLSGDPDHAIARDGERHHWAVDGRPLLLIGTFNKMLEYTGGPFLDLFGAFRRRLRATDQLVICGYGFGDKGINSQVIEWFYERHGRGICVIHPDPDRLARGARGAIRNKWIAWMAEASLRIVAKAAEDTTYEGVRRALADNEQPGT